MRAPEPVSLELRLQARPEAARLVREQLRSWLNEAGVEGDDGFEIVVAVTEAFVNAVEHPMAVESHVIDVEATMASGTVSVTVRDYGSWRDERQRAEGGFGFPLMRKLMDTVAVQPWAEGTAITMQRHLSAAPP